METILCRKERVKISLKDLSSDFEINDKLCCKIFFRWDIRMLSERWQKVLDLKGKYFEMFVPSLLY